MSNKANELLLELLASRIDAAGVHCNTVPPPTPTPTPPGPYDPDDPSDDPDDKDDKTIRFL